MQGVSSSSYLHFGFSIARYGINAYCAPRLLIKARGMCFCDQLKLCGTACVHNRALLGCTFAHRARGEGGAGVRLRCCDATARDMVDKEVLCLCVRRRLQRPDWPAGAAASADRQAGQPAGTVGSPLMGPTTIPSLPLKMTRTT